MADAVVQIGGVQVLALDPSGPKLAKSGDANDLISAAWEHGVKTVLLPVERVDDSFFVLSSALAGEVTQKFVNYQLRLVLIGNILDRIAESTALRDYVYECNRGRHIWFLENLHVLNQKLSGRV